MGWVGKFEGMVGGGWVGVLRKSFGRNPTSSRLCSRGMIVISSAVNLVVVCCLLSLSLALALSSPAMRCRRDAMKNADRWCNQALCNVIFQEGA